MKKLGKAQKFNNFKLENNAFVSDRVDDPARRIEIEVGDTKQEDFYPQFKTKHWDNEVNFSLRLKEDSYEGAELRTLSKEPALARGLAGSGEETPSDIVEWEKDGRIVRMYEIEGFEDGGFQFEVELTEKPSSNVVEYTLQTKGLDFFYQPEIGDEEAEQMRQEGDTRTLEEIKRSMRPENVVGSYAAYHKEKRDNIVGGKHYRTGKAFHIFRPRAIDAENNEVWCELEIIIDEMDDESGVMNITVPQAFLDSAVYPVIVK